MQNRHQIYLTFLGALVLLFISSCKPEEVKQFNATQSGDVSNFAGTWTGISVNQRDIGSENKNFPYKNQDITAPLMFNNVKITLNGTSSGTFSINYGAAPSFFKFSSGNWTVDNASKVGKVYLVSGVDSMTMVVGSYNYLLDKKLQLTQTKTLLGKPAIVYEYLFSK